MANSMASNMVTSKQGLRLRRSHSYNSQGRKTCRARLCRSSSRNWATAALLCKGTSGILGKSLLDGILIVRMAAYFRPGCDWLGETYFVTPRQEGGDSSCRDFPIDCSVRDCLRNALRLSSGMSFNERYTQPDHSIFRIETERVIDIYYFAALFVPCGIFIDLEIHDTSITLTRHAYALQTTFETGPQQSRPS